MHDKNIHKYKNKKVSDNKIFQKIIWITQQTIINKILTFKTEFYQRIQKRKNLKLQNVPPPI